MMQHEPRWRDRLRCWLGTHRVETDPYTGQWHCVHCDYATAPLFPTLEKPGPSGQTCRSCRWWGSRNYTVEDRRSLPSEVSADCRRHAPVVAVEAPAYVGAPPRSVSPQTTAEYDCGDYEKVEGFW